MQKLFLSAILLLILSVVNALDSQQEIYLNDVVNLIGENRFDEAKVRLDHYLKQYPDNAEGNQLYGTLYLKSGKEYEKAVTHYENALRNSEKLTFAPTWNFIKLS